MGLGIMPVGISDGHHASAGQLCDIVVVRLSGEVGIQDALVIHAAGPFEILLLVIACMLIGAVVVLVDEPLAVVRLRVRDEARRVAQGNHPVPVGSAHSDADGLQPVLRGGMGLQIALDHGLVLFQRGGILIVIFLQHRILYLAGSAGTENLADRIVTGMLMTLLTKLSRNWPAAVESAPVRNVDHEILTYLQENYSTITLEEPARHLHYTIPYCSRYVKKLFGCTFSQLLNQIRFQKAHLFLKNSSLTVNQISKMPGCENPYNFMRDFKKIHKMTPSQYRELYHRKTGEERPS